jgi:hypothetical protein
VKPFLIVYLHLQWHAVLRNSRLFAWTSTRKVKQLVKPVWTISENITAVPWKLKVPIQFQILRRKRHSKALRRSEKMHPPRFLKPKSTFLTISILVAGTNTGMRFYEIVDCLREPLLERWNNLWNPLLNYRGKL